MKTIIKITLIFILLNTCYREIYACTSFAVYSNETWYGMNFDYFDVKIKFSIYQSNKRSIFQAQFDSNSYANMNDNGLFANCQMLFYNKRPSFEKSPDTLSIIDLKEHSINELSTIDEIIKYIRTRKITQYPEADLHSLYADKTSHAIIVEPFGQKNGITYLTNQFIVMTSFPNYDFYGKNYNEVYGMGSGHYIEAYRYIKDHKSNFTYNNGIETLKRTAVAPVWGNWPTQVSLLFNPHKLEIYICLKGNFSKVWKVSLKTKTIETYSGYDSYAIKTLDKTGIYASELSSFGK